MPRRIIAPTALTVIVLAAGVAHAGSLHATLTGRSLSVDVPCARQIDIAPDPGLHGQVQVEAAAENQQELDALILESLHAATVHTRPQGCWNLNPFRNEPTLTVSIRVPAGFPLSVDASGIGQVSIGPVGGPLALDLSGAGVVTAADATSLNLDLSGSGSLTLGEANGPASIDMSGHGKVSVATATMPKLAAELSGAGQLTIGAGRIDKLSLSISGVGDVRIGATVGDADAELSGVGSVRLKQVTGQLSKSVSGVGSVTIGE
jgi:hypothetical protein